LSAIAAERGWPVVSVHRGATRIITGLDRGLLALAHDGPQDYR